MDPTLPLEFPIDFKSSTHHLPPDISNIHTDHVRKNPTIVQTEFFLPQKNNFAGPSKPTKQYMEQNSSSSDEENDNYDDPILRKSREQDSNFILPTNLNQDESIEPIEQSDYIAKYKNVDDKITNATDYKALNIPCSHEVLLQGHSKSITAIALDHSGIRIATGSNDYKVRLWDFEGMNKNMNSFRILEPMPVHPIRNLSFNTSNHEILVIASNAQPKIINRDGKELIECIKGDMYIKDMNQTRGHVSMVYDGCFHPVERQIFGSCSFDGTIRFWDRNMKLINIEQQMTQKQVIKCIDQKGLKTGVTAMSFSNDGSIVIGACLNGSVQGFSAKSHYKRPDFVVHNALNTENEASKILFMKDDKRFVVRGMDHTMKIWDIRQTKKPLNVWYNLMNYSPGAKVCLSPDEKYIVTGTSVRKNADDEQCSLLFYDSLTYEQAAEIKMGNFSITDINWHPILNQLFIGMVIKYNINHNKCKISLYIQKTYKIYKIYR